MANLNIINTSYNAFPSNALASLAVSACALDSAVWDNTTGLYTAMDIQLIFGTAFTPTAGGSIYAYLVPSLDGTNYAAPGNSAIVPPTTFDQAFYACQAVSTSVVPIMNIPMTSKAKYKVSIFNNSGTVFPTGTITVTAYPKTLAMV